MNYTTIVELEGVNDEWVTLAGPNAGDWGMYLGEDPKELFEDPPVKVVYEEPGNYPGARYLSDRILKREITFPVIILNDRVQSSFRSWMSRDSFLRRMFAYNKDTKIHVTTPESGRRTLKCRLGDAGIRTDMRFDPDGEPLNVAIVTIVSGDVFWWEDDVIYSVPTLTDTRFTPNAFNTNIPQETLFINVDHHDGKGGLNPTDQMIWLTWSVPASSEPIPGVDLSAIGLGTVPIPWETAPYAQYRIPDYSFEDPEFANRRIKTPGLVIGEDCIINTDPREEQYSAANGAQVWARTNGVRFRNPVPAYIQDKEFEITVSGLAPEETIELRIPRPWSRPWGLE